MPNTTPDNDSSAELNRIELIGVCQLVLRRIRETIAERQEDERVKKEHEIATLMAPRASFFGNPRTRTRDQALAMYERKRQDELMFDFSPSVYHSQIDCMSKLLKLAEASDADTVRVTKTDFAKFSSFWRV